MDLSNWHSVRSSKNNPSKIFVVKLKYFKIYTHWYFTSKRCLHIYMSHFPSYWKGWGIPGTFRHYWWDCPWIWPSWLTIQTQIFNNSFSSWTLFWHSTKITGLKADIIRSLKAVVQLNVASKWHDPNPPKLWDYFLIAKVTGRWIALTWLAIILALSQHSNPISNTSWIKT